MSDTPILLGARSVRRSFGAREVLTGLDIEIREGEFVCLVGRSGAGKTVLLRILAGLDRSYAGRLDVRAPVGVVFQDARLLPWLTVRANVGLGLRPSDPLGVEVVLAETGLMGRADAWPLELSAGEAQRVALARTILRRPEILLLDEPFSALDAFTRAEMQDLLREVIARHRAAALLVTHDLDEALVLADRVLVLHAGTIAHDIAVEGQATEQDMADIRSTLLRWLHAEQRHSILPARRRIPARALLERRQDLRRQPPTVNSPNVSP